MNDPISCLLDTNVISETRKRSPHPGVAAFIARTDPTRMYLSILTLGELRKGIASKRLRDPSRADQVAVWVEGLEYSFGGRVLQVDSAVAKIWGELSDGRTRPVIDTLLAATAIVHGLTLITRNTSDMKDTGVKLLNPFME